VLQLDIFGIRNAQNLRFISIDFANAYFSLQTYAYLTVF